MTLDGKLISFGMLGVGSGATRELLRRAHEHCEQKSWRDAELVYRELLQSAPRNKEWLIQHGHCLKELGRAQEACSAYQHARELGSDDPHAAHFLALHAMREKRWGDAVLLFDEWLKKFPDSAPERVQLGHAAKEAGDGQTAKSAYLRALHDGARDLHMAVFLESAGCLEQALRSALVRLRPECDARFMTPPDPAPPLNFARLMLDFDDALNESQIRKIRE